MRTKTILIASITEMEEAAALVEVGFEGEIRVGMPVGHIYTEIWRSVQKSIGCRWRHQSEDRDPDRGRRSRDPAVNIEVESGVVSAKVNGHERRVGVNYNVFESPSEFLLRFGDFLKELAALSEKLVVQIGDVDKSLFLNFLLDSFNLAGDVEGLIDAFRPVRLTPVQRSGLTCEEMLRTLFLFQNLDDGMRLFLSFNVFSISIYHGDKYIESLLENMYRRVASSMLLPSESPRKPLCSEEYSNSASDRADPSAERWMMAKSLLNGLYLLFDIFNVDDLSLKNILNVLLVLLHKKRGWRLVKFLGLNDVFICAVRSICGDLVPSHLLMMACRNKLNMSYRAASIGVSMDYVYNWVYRPRLAIMMPGWFRCSRGHERNVLVLGRPIETVLDRVTIEVTKDDKESSSARGPAYSPLSRRLSKGLRDKGQDRFRSKQRLDFGC